MALTADLHNRFCLWVFSQRVLVMSAYIYDPLWPPFKRSVPVSLFLDPSRLDALSVALALPRSIYVHYNLQHSQPDFEKCFNYSVSDGLIVFCMVFGVFIQEFGFNLSPIHKWKHDNASKWVEILINFNQEHDDFVMVTKFFFWLSANFYSDRNMDGYWWEMGRDREDRDGRDDREMIERG